MDFSPLGLAPLVLPAGVVGTAYSSTLGASGGTAPYSYQLAAGSGLPPGLTLSPTGTLSGTPLYPGLFQVGIAATDSAARTITKPYVVTIDNAAGQARGLGISPASVDVAYVLTGAPRRRPFRSTSLQPAGATRVTASVSGIPGATLSATSGTAPATINLILSGATFGVGTYAGVIARRRAGFHQRLHGHPGGDHRGPRRAAPTR